MILIIAILYKIYVAYLIIYFFQHATIIIGLTDKTGLHIMVHFGARVALHSTKNKYQIYPQ